MRGYKHGITIEHRRIYNIWCTMMGRCGNPRAKSYPQYGGIGIDVCQEWRSPRAFMEWALRSGYADTLTLDRKDNAKGYAPENCRWATRKQQARNRSNNRMISHAGRSLCMAEWAEVLNIPITALKARFKHGWAPEVALTRPIRHRIGD